MQNWKPQSVPWRNTSIYMLVLVNNAQLLHAGPAAFYSLPKRRRNKVRRRSHCTFFPWRLTSLFKKCIPSLPNSLMSESSPTSSSSTLSNLLSLKMESPSTSPILFLVLRFCVRRFSGYRNIVGPLCLWARQFSGLSLLVDKHPGLLYSCTPSTPVTRTRTRAALVRLNSNVPKRISADMVSKMVAFYILKSDICCIFI